MLNYLGLFITLLGCSVLLAYVCIDHYRNNFWMLTGFCFSFVDALYVGKLLVKTYNDHKKIAS